MAIKINGATVITNSRRGVFKTVNPGAYSTANRPPGASEGDVIYDTDEKNIFIYNGEEWVPGGGGGEGSLIAPTIPPFSGYSTQEVNLSDPDNKVQFSLDGVAFSSTLNVPINTFYYVDFTSDILSAPHNTQYELDIFAEFPEIDQTINPTIKFKVDKLPDPFSFFTESDIPGNFVTTVDPFSPLDTINAPTSIWASSDAALCEIRVADSGWFTAPTAPDTYYVERGEVVQMRHTTGADATTTYTSTLFIGYGTGAGENESGTLSSTTRSLSYDPQPLSLNTGDEISTEGSTFSLPTATGVNVDPVGADWEVASDATFTTIVDSSYDDTVNKNSWQSTVALTQGNTYYARARYIDSSGQKSDWNEKSSLLCDEYKLYRLVVRIQGGKGGKAYWDNNEAGDGYEGGKGQVYLESMAPSKLADLPGYINSTNGGGADHGAAFGSGFLGARGGSSPTSSGSGGGAGGGAGGCQMRMSTSDNYTIIAAVGGTGGVGANDTSHDSHSGRGANLPMANGGAGGGNPYNNLRGTPGAGGKKDYNDPSDPNYNPVGVNGGGGSPGDRSKAGGGGGAGIGAQADGGIPFDGSGGKGSVGTEDGKTYGAGGGASWNRPVGFVMGDFWEVTLVNNGFNNTAQQIYSSSLVNPGATWTSEGSKGHGTRAIKDIAP